MMSQRSRLMLTLAVGLICLVPVAASAITPYFQDFELLDQSSPSALSDDGWVVYGNVFDTDSVTYLYGYGVFPAPNDGFGFCQITVAEGGVDQGFQQLSVFSDYNNGDHAVGRWIESNTFLEQTVVAADVGKTYKFSYQAKKGNLVAPSTALAFIKTLDPSAGYALTNFITLDMTDCSPDWNGYSISLTIDASLEGQLFQIGFGNFATLYESAGIFYDNVLLEEDVAASVPNAAPGATLSQNYPNPFNPMTRIDFALEESDMVEVSVFDLAGHRIATLHRGELGAGDHHVIWNGRTDSGIAAAAGQYRYLLKTSTGQTSRSMVLLK